MGRSAADDAAEARHVPVMVEEVLHWLAPRRGGCIVDGTVGGGGHAVRIAEALGVNGRLIGVDRDEEMLRLARGRLGTGKVWLLHGSFAELRSMLDTLGIEAADGVLLDLGVNSEQLAAPGRGFSFHDPGPLDLRFDRSTGEPAFRLVNRWSAERLAGVFREFGEERYSRRIARALVRARGGGAIEAAKDIAEVIRRAVPGPARRGRIHPATRVFQALRIAVNDELETIGAALRRMPECLKPAGRLVVISFHSLEDRMVKQALRDRSAWEVLTRRPIRPTAAEVSGNPRARSAKLRAGMRVTEADSGS